jgi:hypothetical protein
VIDPIAGSDAAGADDPATPDSPAGDAARTPACLLLPASAPPLACPAGCLGGVPTRPSPDAGLDPAFVALAGR